LADAPIQLTVIGHVESPLVDRRAAPKQGDEGSPEATIVIAPEFGAGIRSLEAGTDVLVLTWLDRAHREILLSRRRDEPDAPEVGVFNTRSPDRPNPIGLHRVRIVAVDGLRIRVQDLEAVDGTPVIDIKPVLSDSER
jgi:tRNA-Thr(GGU) m(6)t(6)A37 methyltransferase TsaA